MLDLPPTDRVKDAFAELTGSVDPLVRPPGVGSVWETVRRRRKRRIGVSVAAAVAVTGVLGLAQLPGLEKPPVDLADPPPAATTLAPTVMLPPFAPPTASPGPAGTSVAPTEVAPGRTPEGGAPVPTRPVETSQPPPPCLSRVTASADGTEVVITAGPVCPGDVIAVSWATYETQRDGSQKLFASDRHTLTATSPRVTVTLRESPTCVGPWYVVRSDPPIPTTIAADAVEPFPSGAVVASEDGEICLS